MILIIFSPDTNGESKNLKLTQEEKTELRVSHKSEITTK